jgi:hypothetical protein
VEGDCQGPGGKHSSGRAICPVALLFPVAPLKRVHASGGPLSCSGKKGEKEPVGEGEERLLRAGAGGAAPPRFFHVFKWQFENTTNAQFSIVNFPPACSGNA